MHPTKKLIAAIAMTGILTYSLFTTQDSLTRIVVLPFLTFSLAYVLQHVCLLLQKKKLAALMGKVYVIAFAIYWFGFLIVWDYLSILRKEYVSLLFSFIFWIGGAWIIFRKLKRKP